MRSARRQFFQTIAGLVASRVFYTRAQTAQRPKRVVQIVIPSQFLPEVRRLNLARFAMHGFISGRNLVYEIVIVTTSGDPVEIVARKVVDSQPDLIMVSGSHYASVLKKLTGTVPILFYGAPDPVRTGLVESFNRPGGNLTGTSSRAFELSVKRLEILLEVSPRSRRVAVVRIAGPANDFYLAELSVVAKKKNVAVIDVSMSADDSQRDIQAAIQRARADAVILTIGLNEEGLGLFPFLSKRGIPTITPWIADVKSGALMSLGEPLDERIARSVDIAVRILRGENPATIPVDQLAKSHFAINMRSAKALGLTIPQSVLVRVDEVIE